MKTTMIAPRSAHSRTLLGVVWLLLAVSGLLRAAPAQAQQGSVLIDNPDGLFENEAAIRAAAQRLAEEGADVVVIGLRDAGTNSDAADAAVDSRLQRLGVAQSARQLRGNQIVFAFAAQPRGYAGIWYVPQYTAKLNPNRDRIYTEAILPRLSDGAFTEAAVAAIDGVRTTLNPPTSPLVWTLAGVLGITILGALVLPVLRRRKAANEALAAARRRMEEARKAAGVALADLGRRVEAAREKAPYDTISYAPQEAGAIQQLQQQGEARFDEAQRAFDAAEEAHGNLAQPSPEEYAALTARYQEVGRLVDAAAEAITAAEQRRAALDAGRAPATGETRRL